jgi:hypothetical protein
MVRGVSRREFQHSKEETGKGWRRTAFMID